MTNREDTATLTELLIDLAALMTDLSETATTRHNQAVAEGISTPEGMAREGQSHAYANSAVKIQDLLDKHSH